MLLVLTSSMACDDSPNAPEVLPPTPPPATPPPAPSPTTAPTARPAPETFDFTVTFDAGSLSVDGPPVFMGARGTLDGSIACRPRFPDPTFMTRASLHMSSGARVESARCSVPTIPPNLPGTCMHLELGLEVEAGGYFIRTEREARMSGNVHTCQGRIVYLK